MVESRSRSCSLPLLWVAVFTFAAYLVTTGPAMGQETSFWMGNFKITVNLSSTTANGQHIGANDWSNLIKQAAKQSPVFTGKGLIAIHKVDVDVIFRDVRLALDKTQNKVVAVSGSAMASTTKLVPTSLKYHIESVQVRVKRDSLRLTPSSATAALSVSIPRSSFALGIEDSIRLSATACDIFPDGSLMGHNFVGTATFTLNKSSYQLTLGTEPSQTVRIGPSIPQKLTRPGEIVLHGTAVADGLELFKFVGSIRADLEHTRFNLELKNPLEREPVLAYRLKLKSGKITYVYGKTGLESCDGSFISDLSLPDSVKDIGNETIVLNDITLKTDTTEALFNVVQIPNSLKLTSALHLRSDSCWVYFPIWRVTNQRYGYQNVNSKNPTCPDLFESLKSATGAPGGLYYQPSAYTRPGLTIMQGVLFLNSPQIVCHTAVPGDSGKVMTLFWGALTATPWGITGELTSSACSFIPLNSSIELSKVTTMPKQYSWEEILKIDSSGGRPPEPEERFLLANLKILRMQIDQMEICMNKLMSSSLSYDVHFPYPSFIDLSFKDTSLTQDGQFHNAAGPIVTFSPEGQSAGISTYSNINLTPSLGPLAPSGISTYSNIYLTPSLGPLTPLRRYNPNPEGRILWAWHLPVSLSDRGVLINYVYEGGNPQLGRRYSESIAVTMDTLRRNSSGEIVSSEIVIPPLYSRNSAMKAGVRFTADMDAKGGFRLTGWDEWPFFARVYSKPETERAAGFDCHLADLSDNGIALANVSSIPLSRLFDFKWHGSLRFPFFASESAQSWQAVNFQIKDIIPSMANDLNLPETERLRSCCTSGTYFECTDPVRRLSVSVQHLKYSYDQNKFASDSVIALENQNNIRAKYIDIISFTRALVFTGEVAVFDTTIREDSSTACGGEKWVRQFLKGAKRSSAFRDLVCFDTTANRERGICDACSEEYFLGTYQVLTRKCRTCTDEKIILSVANAMYFPYSKKLDIKNSELQLSTDEIDEPYTMVINVPSAQFAFTESSVEGAIGATKTEVANSLPYEGEFRFYLDYHCGYFYLQGGGSFTYVVRFTAELFIVHAPAYKLDEVPPFQIMGYETVTPIIEDLRIRTHCSNVQEFKEKIGLAELDPSTIITGVLTGGGASFSTDVDVASVKLEAGLTSYMFQYRMPAEMKYRFGSFLKANGEAQLFDKIGVDGCASLEFSKTTNSLPSVRDLLRKDGYALSGCLYLHGCLSIPAIGDIVGCVKCGASFTSSGGFCADDPCISGDFGDCDGDCCGGTHCCGDY
jgi:hypothetical protein